MNLLLVGVFFAVFVSDLLWTFYIRRASDGKVLPAACFSAAILLVSGTSTMSYVHNGWITALPASAGAFIGTLVAMWWDKRGK